jgi:MFS family permease
MEPASWQLAGGAFVIGMTCGVLFWGIARLALAAGGMWRVRLPFSNDVLAAAGDRERQRHRRLGRELAVLFGAFLSAIIAALLAWLLPPHAVLAETRSWVLIVLLVIAFAAVAGGIFLVYRLVHERRGLRFAWAAKSAVGSILDRLNFSGNRVFHEVKLEGATIDHVVVGAKGVFAVNVVSQPTGLRNAPPRPSSTCQIAPRAVSATNKVPS